MHMIKANTYYVIIEVIIPLAEHSSAKNNKLFLLVDISSGNCISIHSSLDEVKKALLKLVNNDDTVMHDHFKYRFKYEQSTRGTNESKLKPINLAAKLHLYYLKINNRLNDLNILKIEVEKLILHGNIAQSICEKIITNHRDTKNQ